MSGVSISVQGMDQLLKKFGSIPQNVRQEVDAELSATANDFVNRAVNDAPVDQGILKNEITFERIGEMNYKVVSGAEYSAFIEFGTRGRVEVPAELAEYASQFKSSGGGSADVKKMIFDWCQRKGIDPKAWYSIFIKIMTEGIHPHPYFFKQLDQARSEINNNLKSVVERALK